MSDIVRMAGPDCAAEFAPADGGRLRSFRIGGREVLVTKGADAFHFGSFVLAPWVGRLGGASLTHAGVCYRFDATSGPHALHGLVTERAWQATGEGELSIELGAPWPWPCRVVQRTELAAGHATFRIELHAHVATPAAVGWHPWFVRRLEGAPASAELELAVEPKLMWANDATGVPDGTLAPPSPRPWDYCFRDLAADPIVRWPGELELTVRSDCEDWVIYEREDAGVCVEPWTAPPNSLNLPNPRIVLPGRPLTAQMTWTWQ